MRWGPDYSVLATGGALFSHCCPLEIITFSHSSFCAACRPLQLPSAQQTNYVTSTEDGSSHSLGDRHHARSLFSAQFTISPRPSRICGSPKLYRQSLSFTSIDRLSLRKFLEIFSLSSPPSPFFLFSLVTLCPTTLLQSHPARLHSCWRRFQFPFPYNIHRVPAK